MDSPSASLGLGVLGALRYLYSQVLSLFSSDMIGKSILIALAMDISRSVGLFRHVMDCPFFFHILYIA